MALEKLAGSGPARLGRHLKSVLKATEDRDSRVRAKAALALGDISCAASYSRLADIKANDVEGPVREAAMDALRRLAQADSSRSERFAGRKVLIIDDSHVFVHYLVDALARLGVEVRVIAQEDAAIPGAQEMQADAVVCGLAISARGTQIPGFGLAKRLRTAMSKDMRLIVTGEAKSDSVIAQVLETGALYVQQPIGIAQMVDIITVGWPLSDGASRAVEV